MDVVDSVSRFGGIARTRELRGDGITRTAVERAVETGRLWRVRVGWFALPGAPDAVIRAHRLGGSPACATVALAHGLWMLNRPALHVEVVQNASRLRREPDAIVHWVSAESCSPRSGQSLDVALLQMAGCLPALDAICAIDSALHARLITPEFLTTPAGPAVRRVLDACDGRAESGTESVFRVRAAAAGFAFRCQVEVPGGRVDFMFGDRLVVEVDGSEFHSGHQAFTEDRERDAWHSAIGYYVVRLTYAQVVHRWHEVESLLKLLHARAEHLWPARFRKSDSTHRAASRISGESAAPS
jgi:very-short-patch-repair endonuclease